MDTLLGFAKCTPREPAYAASTKIPPGSSLWMSTLNCEILPDLASGRLRFGPNGPLSRQFSDPEGDWGLATPGVNVQFVADSELFGVRPPLVVATHRVEDKLSGSLLGLRLNNTQFGIKKMP